MEYIQNEKVSSTDLIIFLVIRNRDFYCMIFQIFKSFRLFIYFIFIPRKIVIIVQKVRLIKVQHFQAASSKKGYIYGFSFLL